MYTLTDSGVFFGSLLALFNGGMYATREWVDAILEADAKAAAAAAAGDANASAGAEADADADADADARADDGARGASAGVSRAHTSSNTGGGAYSV